MIQKHNGILYFALEPPDMSLLPGIVVISGRFVVDAIALETRFKTVFKFSYCFRKVAQEPCYCAKNTVVILFFSPYV